MDKKELLIGFADYWNGNSDQLISEYHINVYLKKINDSLPEIEASRVIENKQGENVCAFKDCKYYPNENYNRFNCRACNKNR